MKAATEELERVKVLLKLVDQQTCANASTEETMALLRSAQRHLEVAIGLLNRNK